MTDPVLLFVSAPAGALGLVVGWSNGKAVLEAELDSECCRD